MTRRESTPSILNPEGATQVLSTMTGWIERPYPQVIGGTGKSSRGGLLPLCLASITSREDLVGHGVLQEVEINGCSVA